LQADYPLLKCPHCDYYVGAHGLLSHHLKVHQRQYRYDSSDATFALESKEVSPSKVKADGTDEDSEDSSAPPEIPQRHKVNEVFRNIRVVGQKTTKIPLTNPMSSQLK
jgi:hypothetical protein